MKLFRKQKETHTLREQIYGCWGEAVVGQFGADIHTLLY